MDNLFLKLEVLRVESTIDPGTSSRIALVGRAQIPLLKLSNERRRRYGLVRLDGSGYKAEGHIILDTELKKVVREYWPTTN